MKRVISNLIQATFWITLLVTYMMMVKHVIDYDSMLSSCTARETFEIKGERYMCIMLEKL